MNEYAICVGHRLSVSTRIGEQDVPAFRSEAADSQKQDHM